MRITIINKRTKKTIHSVDIDYVKLPPEWIIKVEDEFLTNPYIVQCRSGLDYRQVFKVTSI